MFPSFTSLMIGIALGGLYNLVCMAISMVLCAHNYVIIKLSLLVSGFVLHEIEPLEVLAEIAEAKVKILKYRK